MAAIKGKIKYFILPLLALIAAVALCAVVYGAGESRTMTVTLKNSVLTPENMITRRLWNDETGKYSEYTCYNVYDKSNLTLKVKNGNSTVTLTGAEISRYCADNSLDFTVIDGQRENAWKNGKHKVTYKLGDMSATAEYTVGAGRIKAVSVTPMYKIQPVINTMGYASSFTDSTGRVKSRYVYDLSLYDYYITVSYYDGSEIKCTNHNLREKTGYNAVFSQPEGNLTAGTYTAYCEVGGVRGKFSFTVRENDIKSIRLYFLNGSGNLKFGKDGYFKKNNAGQTLYKFVYNRGDIRAEVTYKNGKVATYALGALCAALDSELIIEDNQDISPYSGGVTEIRCSIRGIPCTVPVWIDYCSVSSLKAVATAKNGYPAVKLSWDYVPCEGYYICQYINGKYERIANIDGSMNTSYIVERLTEEGEYKFTVQAYDDGGSIATNVCKASAVIETPLRVRNFRAGALSDSKIKLYWDKNSLATGYVIQIYDSGKWTDIARLDSNKTTTFVAGNLKAAKTYNFRIKSTSANDGGEANDVYSDTVGTTKPSVISGFSATSERDSITLSWDKYDAVTGYIIEQYKNNKWTRIAKITDKKITSHKVTGLVGLTEYQFRIQCYKQVGEGAVKSGYTPTLITYTKPDVITGFKCTGRTDTAIRLSWDTKSAADGYIIEQYIGDKWVRIAKITDGKTGTYKITGLSAVSRYVFRVQCYKNIKGGALKSKFTDKLVVYTNPGLASGFKRVSNTDSEIVLRWDRNKAVTGYIIQQYKDGKWVRIAKLQNNSVTSTKISGLAPSTRYAFRIQEYKEIGSGAVKGRFTNKLVIHTYPKNVSGFKQGDVTDTMIDLTWNKNTSATGYIVEQYKGNKWVRIAKLTSNSKTFLRVAKLSPSTRYAFRIQAYKEIGKGAVKSGFTKKLAVYTCPTNISGLKVSRVTASEVFLRWDINTSATGYIVEQYKDNKWVVIAKQQSIYTNVCYVTGLNTGTRYKFRVQAYKDIPGGEVRSKYTVIDAYTAS